MKGTQILQKQEARNFKKQNEVERQSKQKEREASRFELLDENQASALIPIDFPEPEPCDDVADLDYYVSEVKPKVKNTNSYDLFVSYGKRNGIKSHVLAGLMNCLRIDDRETDLSKFCSRHKIDNEWARIITKQTRNHLGISEVKCIKFDGKKGPAKMERNKEKIVEKITCIMEPEGTYLDHFEPEDGTAYSIAAGLFLIVLKYDSINSLLVIGGDNCPTNSGTYLLK